MAFEWANADSRDFMSKGYLEPGVEIETRLKQMSESFQAAANTMAKANGKTVPQDLGERFFKYAGLGFYSFASPVLANYGLDRGLPISCNNVVVDDNMGSILRKTAEIGMQTKHGAGTSAYLGLIRPRGSAIRGTTALADGAVHFAQLIESHVEVVRQGGVRRGACAVYQDVESPDILEFLRIQDNGFFIQNLSFGVCIGDQWLNEMLAGDQDKREIWVKILTKRRESGYPYLFFRDNVNRAAPQVYKDKGLKIHSSNLCTEIMLASDPDTSFVCDLGSMNLAKYRDWIDTDAVEVYMLFLDTVMQEYIEKTEGLEFMESARKFAIEQRAVGLGTLGLHTLYQQESIPFESIEARALNEEIHRTISRRARAASKWMADFFGEPPLLVGYGLRNVTQMAIAPTASSSFILGQVSASTEAINSNYFTHDLAKGKYQWRNPELKKILVDYTKEQYPDNPEDMEEYIWKSILVKDGSVQHLTFLTDHQREVFKTFEEISQLEIIVQAAARQAFIDQGQSINLTIHPDTPIKDVHDLIMTAWNLGIKRLYYQRSTSPSQKLARSLVSCTACEA
jgi:ribonucleoside-diphosphate reductase alpha chain